MKKNSKIENQLLEMIQPRIQLIENKFSLGEALTDQDVNTLLMKSAFNHINHLDQRLDEVAADVAQLRMDFFGLEGKFLELEGRFHLLESRFIVLEGRFQVLEDKFIHRHGGDTTTGDLMPQDGSRQIDMAHGPASEHIAIHIGVGRHGNNLQHRRQIGQLAGCINHDVVANRIKLRLLF